MHVISTSRGRERCAAERTDIVLACKSKSVAKHVSQAARHTQGAEMRTHRCSNAPSAHSRAQTCVRAAVRRVAVAVCSALRLPSGPSPHYARTSSEHTSRPESSSMSHGWGVLSMGRAGWWRSRMNWGMVTSSGMCGMGPPSATISAMGALMVVLTSVLQFNCRGRGRRRAAQARRGKREGAMWVGGGGQGML